MTEPWYRIWLNLKAPRPMCSKGALKSVSRYPDVYLGFCFDLVRKSKDVQELCKDSISSKSKKEFCRKENTKEYKIELVSTLIQNILTFLIDLFVRKDCALKQEFTFRTLQDVLNAMNKTERLTH